MYKVQSTRMNGLNILSSSEAMYACAKSTIYRKVHNNAVVAVKQIPRRFCVMDKTGFSLEANAMERLKGHSNAVQHIDTVYDRDDVYIVMEWVNGKNAKEYIQRRKQLLTEANVRDIVRQVAGVLNSCNRMQLIYGDTKAENVMIEPTGIVKLVDFGCTRHINMVSNCYMGTPTHFSPEMFDKVFLPAYDVWSLGILTYYLACGAHPFLQGHFYTIGDVEMIRTEVLNTPVHFNHPIWREWSNDGKDIVREMLQKDPYARPPISQVCENRWFTSAM